MTQAKIVDENAKDGEFFLPWAAERANELESDIFFTWAAAGRASTRSRQNKLFSQIPAVAKGGLVAAANDMEVLAISAASPLSVPYAIDKVVPALAAGAQAASRQVASTLHRTRTGTDQAGTTTQCQERFELALR